MKHFRYLWYLIKHKWYVLIACWGFNITWRGLKHDLSKFLPSEFIPYADYFYSCRVTAKGSPADIAFKKAGGLHYKRNLHHPEHWHVRVKRNDGFTLTLDKMPIETMSFEMKKVDGVEYMEMVADWYAAGRAQGKHSPPDDKLAEVRRWYTLNRTKLLLKDSDKILVENMIGWKAKPPKEPEIKLTDQDLARIFVDGIVDPGIENSIETARHSWLKSFINASHPLFKFDTRLNEFMPLNRVSMTAAPGPAKIDTSFITDFIEFLSKRDARLKNTGKTCADCGFKHHCTSDKLISLERVAQDEKWGVQNHSDMMWLAILVEEVGELSKEVLEVKVQGKPEVRLINELIQVAAVAKAWLECKRHAGISLCKFFKEVKKSE